MNSIVASTTSPPDAGVALGHRPGPKLAVNNASNGDSASKTGPTLAQR